jgi:hypothetical protein
MKKRALLLAVTFSVLLTPASFAFKATCSLCRGLSCVREYTGYQTCTQGVEFCAEGPDTCPSGGAAANQAPTTFAAKWHLVSVTTNVTPAKAMTRAK